jgi:hypothetical protein
MERISYREVIGFLMYVMIATRLEITIPIGVLSKFVEL